MTIDPEWVTAAVWLTVGWFAGNSSGDEWAVGAAIAAIVWMVV